MSIQKKHIVEAADRIQKFVHKTAILKSATIDKMAGAVIYFKCENFQKTGAFKARGAFNFALQLSSEELKRGLCTHSSGNHAQAVAFAASQLGSKAFIVMPSNSSQAKVDAVQEYGAEVSFCHPTLDAREQTLNKIQKNTNAVFIPPYDHPWIIAGQATSALELIQEEANLDVIITPVGGGGLLAGTSLSAKYFSKAKVIGAEPKGADDAYRSFYAKTLLPSINPNTMADGLLTSLGHLNFEVIQKNVSDVLTCDEAEIKNAMRLIWERMKIIIEPSSAVALAVLLKNSTKFKNKKVGIILSGGNVDLEKLIF